MIFNDNFISDPDTRKIMVYSNSKDQDQEVDEIDKLLSTFECDPHLLRNVFKNMDGDDDDGTNETSNCSDFSGNELPMVTPPMIKQIRKMKVLPDNQRFVQHDYIDFSQSDKEEILDKFNPLTGDTYESIILAGELNNLALIERRKIGAKRIGLRDIRTFPVKLHEMLHDEICQDIIEWLPHGRSFVVLDQEKLVNTILPCYLKREVKFNSFMRQLQLWGFVRIQDQSYYHQCFLRGMPGLVRRIELLSRKDNGGKKLVPNPDGEPNFYELAKYRPLPESIVVGNVEADNNLSNIDMSDNLSTVELSVEPFEPVLEMKATGYLNGNEPFEIFDSVPRSEPVHRLSSREESESYEGQERYLQPGEWQHTAKRRHSMFASSTDRNYFSSQLRSYYPHGPDSTYSYQNYHLSTDSYCYPNRGDINNVKEYDQEHHELRGYYDRVAHCHHANQFQNNFSSHGDFETMMSTSRRMPRSSILRDHPIRCKCQLCNSKCDTMKRRKSC